MGIVHEVVVSTYLLHASAKVLHSSHCKASQSHALSEEQLFFAEDVRGENITISMSREYVV